MRVSLRLQTPKLEGEQIVHRRFPVPRVVDCDQNGSQVLQRPLKGY